MTTQIRVLGPGCARCQALYENTLVAVVQFGLDAQVTKVDDMSEMLTRGIMTTPALVVDDVLVMAGDVPDPIKVGQLLINHIAAQA
jgi:small redox-active disulfide protein 2